MNRNRPEGQVELFQPIRSCFQRNGYFYDCRHAHRSRSGRGLSPEQADGLGAIGAFEGLGRETAKQGRTAGSKPRRGSQVRRRDRQGSRRALPRPNAPNGLDGASRRWSVLHAVPALPQLLSGVLGVIARSFRANAPELRTWSANIRFS